MVYGILKRYEKPDRTELLSMSGESDAGHTLYKSAGWGRAFERKGLLLQWDGDIHNRKDLCRELGLPLDASDEDIVLDGTARHGTEFFRPDQRLFRSGPFGPQIGYLDHRPGASGAETAVLFSIVRGIRLQPGPLFPLRLPWVTGGTPLGTDPRVSRVQPHGRRRYAPPGRQGASSRLHSLGRPVGSDPAQKDRSMASIPVRPRRIPPGRSQSRVRAHADPVRSNDFGIPFPVRVPGEKRFSSPGASIRR